MGKITKAIIIGTILVSGVLVSYTAVDQDAVDRFLNPPPQPEPQILATSTKKYKAPNYNENGVRYEKIRKSLDKRYQEIHDTLSKAYYEKTPFVWQGVDYGVLSKDQFDDYQAMIWAQYEIHFDEENKALPVDEQIPDAEYNERYKTAVDDETGETSRVKVKVDQEAKDLIKNLKKNVTQIDF